MLTRRGGHFATRRWYRRRALFVAVALVLGIAGGAAAAVRDRGGDGPTRLSVVTTSTVATSTSIPTLTTTVTAGASGGVTGSAVKSASVSPASPTTARVKVATTAKRTANAPAATTPTTAKPTTTTRPSWEKYCAPHCSPGDHTQPTR